MSNICVIEVPEKKRKISKEEEIFGHHQEFYKLILEILTCGGREMQSTCLACPRLWVQSLVLKKISAKGH